MWQIILQWCRIIECSVFKVNQCCNILQHNGEKKKFRSSILEFFLFNTSYLTDSYIVFTLKMESVSKNTIFGLKMMVKSGLEKIFLKFLHAGNYFPLLHKSGQNHKFSNENNYFPAWRDFKINFSKPLFTIIFRPKMVFLDTDSILRVKPMYESVK